MIILLKNSKKKHVVHGLSIDSFIPLSKQPTAGVRNVLPHANTRLQTLSPFADSSVNNTFLQTAPNVNQSPLEFVDIVDLHLVHTLLHDPPNL